MTLNRSQAPLTTTLDRINLEPIETFHAPSGVPVYVLNSPVEQCLKIEIVFAAGICNESQPLVASLTNAMLTEGTKNKTAAQIADELDYYGSYIQNRCTIDDAQITLYCLKKHSKTCLSIIYDIIVNAAFNEEELALHLKNSKQRLRVKQKKTSYLCRKSFYNTLFGPKSPIVTFYESNDYDNISRETLIDFYTENYSRSIKYITASGDCESSLIDELVSFANAFSVKKTAEKYKTSKTITNKKAYIKKEKSSQATIRVGKQIPNRSHQNYRHIQMYNLALGGYFGSRLMKNIREDKGLTYGIYSSVDSYFDDGCFYIEADINTEKTDLALDEIYKEIDLLNNFLVSEEELNIAKNYFCGSLLRGFDGPFTIMDKHRVILDYNLPVDYYAQFFDIIKNTTPNALRDIGNEYFTRNTLVETVCGG